MLMRGRGSKLISTRKIEGRGVKRIMESSEFHLSLDLIRYFLFANFSIAYIEKIVNLLHIYYLK